MKRFLFSVTIVGVAIGVVALIPKTSSMVLGRANAYTNLNKTQSQDEKRTAWLTLLSFESQNLSKLDRPQALKLQTSIEALIGKRENELLVPLLLTKISDANAQTKYALVVESPLLTIPGNSGLNVHIFTPQGSLIRSSNFLTGWRIILTDIRIAYLPQIGRQALKVSSEPVVNGRDVAKQFYALVDDRVLLIRLEDVQGRLIRNVYGAPNYTFGFTVVTRSADDWEKALASNDTAEVLATLTWLGGRHWNPQQPLPEYQHEDIEEARLADIVRARKGVKAVLLKLVASENAWVRHAARLAAKPEYYSSGSRIGRLINAAQSNKTLDRSGKTMMNFER